MKFTSREPFGFSSRNESCCRWPWREDAQFHSETAMKPNTTPSTDMCRYPKVKMIWLVVLPRVPDFVLISYREYFANTECDHSGSGWTSPSWRCVRSRCDWLKWRTGAEERTNGVRVLLDGDAYLVIFWSLQRLHSQMFACNDVCKFTRYIMYRTIQYYRT